MFDKIKKLFTNDPPPKTAQPTPAKKKVRVSKNNKVGNLSEKEIASQRGEPYIAILRVNVDPSNINAGEFELDWNDKFIVNLIRAGYKQRPDDTDQILVDRWFQTVCRNIALEVYEQQAADPKNSEYEELRRVQSRDLGNGRSEIS